MSRRCVRVLLLAAVAAALWGAAPQAVLAPSPAAAATPKGPVGWQGLRRLDLLPLFSPGGASGQFSSYDRSGGNEDGLENTCLRRDGSACVVAEHSGPGEIQSIWFTRDSGDVSKVGNLRIVLDGRTVLEGPLQSVVDGALGPPFSPPLVANADRSSGGVYIKVPMPFRQSMTVTVDGEPRYYHVAYRRFADADGVPSFNPADRVPDVLAKLAAAGTRDPKPPLAGPRSTLRRFALPAGRSLPLARLEGPGAITALRLRLSRLSAPRAGQPSPPVAVLRDARLRISFDGRRTVDAPLGEFFGSGLLPAPVRALTFAQSAPPGLTLTSWWPMPFRRGAEVSLVNASPYGILAGDLLVARAPAPHLVSALAGGRAGHFHATSRRGSTVPGRNWEVLSATGPGKLVGISHTMRGMSNDYLEGDEQVWIDGARTPQILGTGTEDFYEGGFYFSRGQFTGPFNGNPVRLVGNPACAAPDCTAAYRVMVNDAITFQSSLRFDFEHGHANSQQAVYGTTAYWYG